MLAIDPIQIQARPRHMLCYGSHVTDDSRAMDGWNHGTTERSRGPTLQEGSWAWVTALSSATCFHSAASPSPSLATCFWRSSAMADEAMTADLRPRSASDRCPRVREVDEINWRREPERPGAQGRGLFIGGGGAGRLAATTVRAACGGLQLFDLNDTRDELSCAARRPAPVKTKRNCCCCPPAYLWHCLT